MFVDDKAAVPILQDAFPRPEEAIAEAYERVATLTWERAAAVSVTAAGQVPGKS